MIRGALNADKDIRVVVISLEESYDLDSTGLDALIEFDRAMGEAGLHVQLARVHDHVRDLMNAGGAADLVARSSYSVDDAVRAATAVAMRGDKLEGG
jgi:ABC-type transporter Mla MlaB component